MVGCWALGCHESGRRAGASINTETQGRVILELLEQGSKEKSSGTKYRMASNALKATHRAVKYSNVNSKLL